MALLPRQIFQPLAVLGIAVDPVKNMNVHNSGKDERNARSRLPVTMVYSEPQPDQPSALKREAEVSKWSRQKKEALIAKECVGNNFPKVESGES